MYERVKDQRAWQLEQSQELSALKEKIDATQEIGVANHVLDGQTAMGLASLTGGRGGVTQQANWEFFESF